MSERENGTVDVEARVERIMKMAEYTMPDAAEPENGRKLRRLFEQELNVFTSDLAPDLRESLLSGVECVGAENPPTSNAVIDELTLAFEYALDADGVRLHEDADALAFIDDPAAFVDEMFDEIESYLAAGLAT